MIDARLSGWFALAAQAAAGFAFALAFHFLHSLLTAIVMGGSLSSFDVRPVLPGPASIWQLSQGMLVYAVAALAATLIAAREQALPLPSSEPDAKPSFPQRFFVKDRDEVRPLEVADIACISGAGDYSEILTRTGVHLTRIRLQSFAAQLDPELFVRVHRSLIVSYQSIVRFEPDGTGRLNVELDNGRMVRTSREGAARLKERLL